MNVGMYQFHTKIVYKFAFIFFLMNMLSNYKQIIQFLFYNFREIEITKPLRL